LFFKHLIKLKYYIYLDIYPPPPPPYGFNPALMSNNSNTLKREDNTEQTTSPFIQPIPNTEINNGWTTFLTGAAVGGISTYLFSSRRK
jgi:hypothetical protein